MYCCRHDGVRLLHYFSERSELFDRHFPEICRECCGGKHLPSIGLRGIVPTVRQSHVSPSRHSMSLKCHRLLWGTPDSDTLFVLCLWKISSKARYVWSDSSLFRTISTSETCPGSKRSFHCPSSRPLLEFLFWRRNADPRFFIGKYSTNMG